MVVDEAGYGVGLGGTDGRGRTDFVKQQAGLPFGGVFVHITLDDLMIVLAVG